MCSGGLFVGLIIGGVMAIIVNHSWYRHCKRLNEEWYETCLGIINMDADEAGEEDGD